MKQPVDLLCTADSLPGENRESQTALGKNASGAVAADTAKPGHGAFVDELAGSIIRRNAQARKGQRGGEGARARNRQALSRALQKLMQE